MLSPLADLVDLKGASNYVPKGDLVKASYEAAPDSVKAFTVSNKAPAFNILFITKPASLNERAVVVDDMRERLGSGAAATNQPPKGIDVGHPWPGCPREARQQDPRRSHPDPGPGRRQHR